MIMAVLHSLHQAYYEYWRYGVMSQILFTLKVHYHLHGNCLFSRLFCMTPWACNERYYKFHSLVSLTLSICAVSEGNFTFCTQNNTPGEEGSIYCTDRAN